MKKIYLLFICIITVICTLISCKREPEFYINNKPYYSRERCVNSHTVEVWEWYYGYSVLKGKFCYHYGYHDKTICDVSVIDTIEIK